MKFRGNFSMKRGTARPWLCAQGLYKAVYTDVAIVDDLTTAAAVVSGT